MSGPAAARTGPGRRSALPVGAYQPPSAARIGPGGAEVAFTGDDGRSGVFRFAGLPLPGWHEPVAAAFAARTGPAGGLRTLASASDLWQAAFPVPAVPGQPAALAGRAGRPADGAPGPVPLGPVSGPRRQPPGAPITQRDSRSGQHGQQPSAGTTDSYETLASAPEITLSTLPSTERQWFRSRLTDDPFGRGSGPSPLR